MKDNGIFIRKPNYRKIDNPTIIQGNYILGKKRLPNTINESQAYLYHNISYSASGTTINENSYKYSLPLKVYVDEFTLDFDYKTKYMIKYSSINDYKYDNENGNALYTTKRLEGYSDIKGTLYQKNEDTLYDIDTYVELYDKGSNFKYGEFEVHDGIIDINKINTNTYTMKVIDSTGKYSAKIIDVDVVDINEDYIEPKIILLAPCINLIEEDDKFIQKIIIKNCLSSNVSLSIDNKPIWLQVDKFNDTTYIISGKPPNELLESELELTYSLYDYRITGIKSSSISKKYIISKKSMFKVFNNINDPDFIKVNGNIVLTSYNGLSGIEVNGKNNTFHLRNKVPSSKNTNFTMMFAFTVKKFINLATKHNLFIGNSSSNSTGTFWLGLSPTSSKTPRLSICMDQSRSVTLNAIIEEGKTYFLKIVRKESKKYIFLNGRLIDTYDDGYNFGLENKDFMFGDGGWGDYSTNIIIHEYDFINDHGDISNLIEFKCSDKIITTNKYRRFYNFKLEGLNFITKSNSSIMMGTNATFYKEIIKEFKEYSIFLKFKVSLQTESNIMQISKLKIYYNNKKIYFNYDGIDIHDMTVSLDSENYIEYMYDGNKLEVYYMGGKQISINNSNLKIDKTNTIYLRRSEDNNTKFHGTLKNICIYEGVSYIGDHNHLDTFDENLYINKSSSDYDVNYGMQGELLNEGLITTETNVISNNVSDFKPIEVGGSPRFKNIDGKATIYFEKPEDYFIIQEPNLSSSTPEFRIEFDLYWSGERTGTLDTVISSVNTLGVTTYESQMMVIRADGGGANPRMIFNNNGYAAITTNYNLSIGWNKIKIYRNWYDYYWYFEINGLNTGQGYSYSTAKLGGNNGYLVFGKNSFDKQGLTKCAIANLMIAYKKE